MFSEVGDESGYLRCKNGHRTKSFDLVSSQGILDLAHVAGARGPMLPASLPAVPAHAPPASFHNYSWRQ
ncbi:unnamed protein product [Tuber melanosporum]|uniref:(Perigord truffle) hypothetical protein n=1 Tax=Tuber melanosporum (strain Mel28) TaxID=656061 RepID=D5GKF9_TUBMM|nr:uncharacterized protein GSTUM_00009521001 [Tuber melanosporum]CAZ85002.1 unnamed protein product [Tuber melanosporum]